MAEKLKNWVKMEADVPMSFAREEKKAVPAYVRDREYDSSKDVRQDTVSELVASMTHAHNNISASNKAIRNSFYGQKGEDKNG